MSIPKNHLLLIEPTIRLLFYTKQLDLDELYDACYLAGLTADQVIASKCSFISQAIMYLIDAKPRQIMEAPSFGSRYGYRIELRGIRPDGSFSKISHDIILLATEKPIWVMYDSYTGARPLSKEAVRIDRFITLIKRLKHRWDPESWQELTGDGPKATLTERVSVLVTEFSYSLSIPELRFKQLIDESRQRLLYEEEGINDVCYLGIISDNLSTEEARIYIDSLACYSGLKSTSYS